MAELNLDSGITGVEVREVRNQNNQQNPEQRLKAQSVDMFDEFEFESIPRTVTEEAEPQESIEKADREGKAKGGRKARVSHDELHTEFYMSSKKSVIHEAEVLEVVFKSMNKALIMELLFKQFLQAKDIYEDNAPTVIGYMWNNARMVDGRKMYLDTLNETAKAIGVSYPSTQKIVKKMLDKGILEKERNGMAFDSLLIKFLESLTVNKQMVFTFDELEEEQLEAIDESGRVNEQMTD